MVRGCERHAAQAVVGQMGSLAPGTRVGIPAGVSADFRAGIGEWAYEGVINVNLDADTKVVTILE